MLLRAVLSLGIETLVLTNAAGGVNRSSIPGDVMIIRDTINLSGSNPLLGPNLDRFGPRFVAMADAWDEGLRVRARSAGERAWRGAARRRCYLMLCPVRLTRTRAELRMLTTLGADACRHCPPSTSCWSRATWACGCWASACHQQGHAGHGGEVNHEEVLAMGQIGGRRGWSALRRAAAGARLSAHHPAQRPGRPHRHPDRAAGEGG
jgi:purine-nucleoside phosphorylase